VAYIGDSEDDEGCLRSSDIPSSPSWHRVSSRTTALRSTGPSCRTARVHSETIFSIPDTAWHVCGAGRSCLLDQADFSELLQRLQIVHANLLIGDGVQDVADVQRSLYETAGLVKVPSTMTMVPKCGLRTCPDSCCCNERSCLSAQGHAPAICQTRRHPAKRNPRRPMMGHRRGSHFRQSPPRESAARGDLSDRSNRKALWSFSTGESVPRSPISYLAISFGFATSLTSKSDILTPWYQAKSPSSAATASLPIPITWFSS